MFAHLWPQESAGVMGQGGCFMCIHTEQAQQTRTYIYICIYVYVHVCMYTYMHFYTHTWCVGIYTYLYILTDDMDRFLLFWLLHSAFSPRKMCIVSTRSCWIDKIWCAGEGFDRWRRYVKISHRQAGQLREHMWCTARANPASWRGKSTWSDRSDVHVCVCLCIVHLCCGISLWMLLYLNTYCSPFVNSRLLSYWENNSFSFSLGDGETEEEHLHHQSPTMDVSHLEVCVLMYLYMHVYAQSSHAYTKICWKICFWARTQVINWFLFPIIHTNWDVCDDRKLFVFSPGTVKLMTERSQSRLKSRSEQFWYKLLPYGWVNTTIKISLIDWFWLPIFRTNLVRGLSK